MGVAPRVVLVCSDVAAVEVQLLAHKKRGRTDLTQGGSAQKRHGAILALRSWDIGEIAGDCDEIKWRFRLAQAE
jgi:hypothetical protein